MQIRSLSFGKNSPIHVQSMTDTDTSNINATLSQILELEKAGSELVRITVDTPDSAKAVPEIIQKLRKVSDIPVVGDFHFNGHILLEKYPQMAKSLDKWRINPGNVGKKYAEDKNYEAFLSLAKKYEKPFRIGVNGGSLDQNFLQKKMDEGKEKNWSARKIIVEAMVETALFSEKKALDFGINPEKIFLSVKHSDVQTMVEAYRILKKRSQSLLHLGLTEAGGGIQGMVSSSVALGILLSEDIGDTIRVSITPKKNESRTKEVEVAKNILQSLGKRRFSAKIISCPGCGRTTGNDFRDFSDQIREKISNLSEKYPTLKQKTIAVMGCVVNGRGEASSADIGIFFPGKGEGVNAILSVKGQKEKIITGENILEVFTQEVEKFVSER